MGPSNTHANTKAHRPFILLTIPLSLTTRAVTATALITSSVLPGHFVGGVQRLLRNLRGDYLCEQALKLLPTPPQGHHLVRRCRPPRIKHPVQGKSTATALGNPSPTRGAAAKGSRRARPLTPRAARGSSAQRDVVPAMTAAHFHLRFSLLRRPFTVRLSRRTAAGFRSSAGGISRRSARSCSRGGEISAASSQLSNSGGRRPSSRDWRGDRGETQEDRPPGKAECRRVEY